MRKSENISKYNLAWQLCRVSIKGGRFSCEEKISKVFEYYEKKPSLQRWERVYNFLEGLQRGYKSANMYEEILLIQTHLDYFNISKGLKLEAKDSDDWCSVNKNIDLSLKLYKDLFKRSTTWLKSGYFHKEQEAFIDKLYKSLVDIGCSQKSFGKYSIERLIELRCSSSTMKNEHNFFF